MILKVLSWNIWRGRHFKEIIEFLESENADIIGLQEVTQKGPDIKTNIAYQLSKKLGYDYIFCQALDFEQLGEKYEL